MGGIWQGGDKMGLVDALLYSLAGIATVFMALVALAIAIIIVTKILEAMGLGSDSVVKKEVKAATKATAAQAVQTTAMPVEEDTQEYAVIMAAISEHTRIPVERLRINSITKR